MNDENQRRLDALKVARQLLNEEYIAQRAEEYNKWLVDSQVAWKTQGIKLPPPSSVITYPSEQEIVAKALEYYNFITAGGKQSEFKTTPLAPKEEIITSVKEEPKIEEPKINEPDSLPIPDSTGVESNRVAPTPPPPTAANAIPTTNYSQINSLAATVSGNNSPLIDAVPPELKTIFANSIVDISANTSLVTTNNTSLKNTLPTWLQRLHGITKE